MLLQITHLGTDEHDRRLYHAQTPRGLGAVVALSKRSEREINVLLQGTHYRRAYPSPYPIEGIPRIRDLEGGYQVIQTFLATWEHSTPEQRELLQEHDKPIAWYRFDSKQRATVRTGRKLRLAEDRPRHVSAARGLGDWHRVYVKDLRAALKGTKQADPIRVGHITVKRSVLYGLINTKSALGAEKVLELKPEGNAIAMRSADGRAKVRILHGAGDRYKGRYGWARRIQFVAAA